MTQAHISEKLKAIISEKGNNKKGGCIEYVFQPGHVSFVDSFTASQEANNLRSLRGWNCFQLQLPLIHTPPPPHHRVRIF